MSPRHNDDGEGLGRWWRRLWRHRIIRIVAATCTLATVLAPTQDASAFVPPNPDEFMEIPYAIERHAVRHEYTDVTGSPYLACQNVTLAVLDSKYAIGEGVPNGLGYHEVLIGSTYNQNLVVFQATETYTLFDGEVLSWGTGPSGTPMVALTLFQASDRQISVYPNDPAYAHSRCDTLVQWGIDHEAEYLDPTQLWTRNVDPEIVASCAVQSQTGPGGSELTFVGSVESSGTGYQQAWTFGDGSTSSAGSVAKTAQLPGPFTAQFRAWVPGTNIESVVNCDAEVAAPELGVSVAILGPDGEPVPDDAPPGVGDEIDVRVRVLATANGIGALNELTAFDPAWVNAAGPVELLTAPSLPAPFSLTPGSSVDLVFRYRILSAGDIAFSTTVVGEDAIGRPVQAEGSVLDSVGGIEVEVGAAWPVPPGGGDTPAEFQADNNGDGTVDDADHVLTIEVTAKNLLDEPLTNVRMREADEAIDFVNRLVGEGAAAIELLPGEDYTTGFGDVGPGVSVTRTYRFQATAEVNADAHAYLRGDTGAGAVVAGHGSAGVQLDSHLALEAWMDLEERPYQSGQVVRLNGRITSLLEDETLADGTVEPAKNLAVILDPIVEGNSSNGYVTTADFGGRTPQGNSPFVLLPGQSVDVAAIVATARKDTPSVAGIRYLVRAWAFDPADPDALGVEIDRSRISIDEDDGHGTEFTTALAEVALQPDKVQECETTLLDAVVTCNLWVGLREFGTGLAQLGPVIAQGGAESGRAGWAIRAWMYQHWANSILAVLGDEAATQRLITEVEVQLSTFTTARIHGAAAIGAVHDSVVEFLREAEQVLRRGDTNEIVAWVARFLGENPDLGIGALAKVRTARALFGTALPSASQSTATAAIVDAAEDAAAVERAGLTAKIDDSIARGENPTTNGTFLGDEDITAMPRVFRGIYGARKTELAKMLEISANENVLIAFRSRSPRAADLIRDGLARPKPMDVKTKGVNEIDIAYLGYRREAKDLVELVEPPIDWRLAREGREAEFEAALDTYMTFLEREGGHGELSDPVWRAEVRSRLKTRTKQWIKEVPNFRTYATKGINVEFGFSEQGLPASLDDHVAEVRKAKVNSGSVTDPYTGEKRLYFNVEMADASGNNFLPITGDIDIVAILNSDRTPLTDVTKRTRIYRELAKLVGMQHGDSFTWINNDGMVRFMREHVAGEPGAEALVVAGNDGRARMGYFEERLSTAADADGNLTSRSTFHMLTGAPRELLTNPSGGVPTNVSSYFDQLEGYVLDPAFYVPGALEDFMDGVERSGDPPELDDTAPVIRPDGEGGAEAYQPAGGDVGSAASDSDRQAQPARSYGNALGRSAQGGSSDLDDAVAAITRAGFGPAASPSVGAQGGRWVPFDAQAAAAASPTGRFPRGVASALDGAVPAGSSELPVVGFDVLEVAQTSDWFEVGDSIVVDPGGLKEERHTVASVNPLRTAEPLLNDHAHATMVALVPEEVPEVVETTTTAPATAAPTTSAPTTAAPPTTAVPTTVVPTTVAPTTPVPEASGRGTLPSPTVKGVTARASDTMPRTGSDGQPLAVAAAVMTTLGAMVLLARRGRRRRRGG